MISIENLTYAYVPGEPALKNISATLPDKSSISVVLGESGSGKTTFLRCFGKFLTPQSGRILVDGTDVQQIAEKEFRRKVGIVFQRLYLFPHLSVLGNLTLALEKVARMHKKEARDRSNAMLDRLGIVQLADSYPVQLSGGQAQRVAIARALVLQPRYLLLDEPTSALDINTTRDFGDWLLHLQERTKFIIVTHDIPFAREVASDGILMEQGEVKACGQIEEIVNTFTALHQPAAASVT
ncbi:MAG: amino acid ABC transporter ATP-binding protein [Chitinivibrionales bacterium]